MDMENGVSTPIQSAPKKKNNGLIFGLVFCLILAVAGVGFGVYGMMRSSSTSSDLKVQVKDSSGSISVLDASAVEVADNTVTITETTPVATTTTSSDKYIYIGAWGLKIALPDDLTPVSYRFSDKSVCVSGAKYSGQQYVPDFADNAGRSPLACVSRLGDDDERPDYAKQDPDFTLGGYRFFVEGAQDVSSEDKDEVDWEVESRNYVVDLLSDKSNYSTF